MALPGALRGHGPGGRFAGLAELLEFLVADSAGASGDPDGKADTPDTA